MYELLHELANDYSYNLKEVRNFQKIPEMLGFDGESWSANFDIYARKSQKVSCKIFHKKSSII